MALPGNQLVSALPVLSGRLLLQTPAVHGPVLLLRPERLLLQAAAMRGAILLFWLRRLLREADPVHLAVLHSAGRNLRPAVQCESVLREALR